MKILISGSRKCTTPNIVFDRLNKLPREDLIIIHGSARGVDSLAHVWCVENSVQVRPYPADWSRYGKSAGPIRNREMLKENPDLVIAFPCPKSKGTRDMIEAAKSAGFEVEVVELGDESGD